MNKEELLRPRYKVIADYPDSTYRVGGIIVIDKIFPNRAGYEADAGKPCNYKDGVYRFVEFYESYPHLFKKLEWWEDRKPEDMPEYLKFESGNVFKVAWVIDARGILGAQDENGSWFDKLYVRMKHENAAPSTEAEYNEYKSKP